MQFHVFLGGNFARCCLHVRVLSCSVSVGINVYLQAVQSWLVAWNLKESDILV